MKSLNRLILTAMLLLTVATGYAKPSLDEQIKNLTLADNEGLIILKAVMPKTVYGSTPPNWMGLGMLKDGNEKGTTVVNIADREDDYSLFFAKLPAGKYALWNLHVFLPKQTSDQFGSKYSSENFALRLGGVQQFEIQPGAVSDLGVVITLSTDVAKGLPVNSMGAYKSEQAMQAIWSYSPAESARLIELLRAKLPKLRVLREGEAWLSAPQVPLLALNEVMPQLLPLGSKPILGADGQLYRGAALGRIRLTTDDGSTRWINTGLSGSIRAMAVGEDGTLVGGASMGLLAVLSPGAGEWRTLQLPYLNSKPLEISMGPQGLHVLVRHEQEAILLHRASVAATAPWVELKRFSISRVGYSSFEMLAEANGISLLEHSYGWSAGTTLHHYDGAKKAWSESEVPADWKNGAGVAALAPGGWVVCACAKRNNPQVMRVSSDYGKTWREGAGPDKFQRIQMTSRTHGLATRIDSIRTKEGGEFTASLWGTEDGGLSWRKLGSTPILFDRVARMSASVLVSSNYRSVDNGQSWAKH